MPSATDEKRERLAEILRSCESVLIGYSGGVDSAYLAKAALDALGRSRVLAVTGISPTYPKAQLDIARRIVREFDIPHLEIETDELLDPRYAANPVNRCYFCKTELFGRLHALAQELGFAVVCDGSNADDLHDFRPGAQAARERGVRSPLQEAGLSKEEIRALSREAGLPTWDLPASPCLASRIVYGLAVTPERLKEIERAEDALRAIAPWRHLRVRHHGECGRVEVDPGELGLFADRGVWRRAVEAMRNAGFTRVLLDLEGYRRGSLHEGIVSNPPGSGDGTGSAAPFAIERCGRAGEVAVLALEQESLQRLLSGSRLRRALVAAKPAGVRYLTVDLGRLVDLEVEASGCEALRRPQPSGG